MTEQAAGQVNMKEEFLTKLCIAIKTGDEARVKDVLSQRPYGYISEEPFTDKQEAILLEAMLRGNLSMIQLLLDFGANFHLPVNPRFFSYLSFAAYIDKQEMVEFLFERGVDVNSMTSDGRSALHLAFCTGSLNIVNLLLEKGANVDGKTQSGLTALHGAAGRGHKDVVQILLNHRANLAAKDNKGKTPLTYAVGGGDFEIVNLVKIEIEPCSDQSGFTVSCTCRACAKQKNFNHILALEQTVVFLLQKGADIHDKDKNGNSVLHYAIRSGYKSIIDLLLNNGARLGDNKILSGKNLLTYACESNNSDLVKLLLDNGANPNQGTVDNYTPLHAAAVDGYNEIAEMLLDKGANINLFGSLKVRNYGFHEVTPLQCAVFGNHKSTVELLLSRGADILATGSDGYSVLHFAVSRANKEMIKLLLKWGIDVDFRKGFGTSLHIAAYSEQKDITELLLDRGANLNIHSLFTIIIDALDKSKCSENAKVFMKELVKLTSLNLFTTDDDIINYISVVDSLNIVKKECENEIEKLKEKTFPNTTTSYFSVFEKQPGELASLASNENIIEAISSDDFLEKEFPIYASTIVKCIIRGLVRKEIQDQLSGLFFNLYKDKDLNEPLPVLHEDCVNKIFDLLNNDDLKNLMSEYRCSKNILTVDEY